MKKCDFCDYRGLESFTQTTFVAHLRTTHLLKVKKDRSILFRCSYGPNGECFTVVDNKQVISEFNTEKEYGLHLLREHLKQCKVSEKSLFSVSDNGCLENSRNYEIVRNHFNHVSQKWTPHHSKVNLPAALNEPNNRQLDIFSKTWGDTFEKAEPPQCMTLLSPTKLLFVPYIKQVRSSLKYREVMLKKINVDKQQETSAGTHNHRVDVDNVPKLFFQTDFNLNCKDIFLSVIPISPPSLDKFSNSPSRSARNYKSFTEGTANRTNEKLSNYLDVIEINIAKQVSKKSNSFFEAVSTQDKVQDKIKSALAQISIVREKLLLSDTKLTRDHLKVLIMAQRKNNMQLLLKQLRVIKTVHSAQATIQTLLASNDFCGVLDLIAGTQSIMKMELLSSRSNESSPILCLKHVWAQLSELKIFVEKMVQQEFVNTVSSQLRIEEDWNSYSKSLEIDYQMVPSLLAMMRILLYNESGNLNQFVQLYFDDAMEVLKTIVKCRVVQAFSRSCQSQDSTVINSSQEDNLPRSLADQMRSLDYDRWIGLVHDICEDMLQLLEKVKVGCHTMIETLSVHIDDSGLKSHGECFNLTSNCNPSTILNLRTLTMEEIMKLPFNISEAIEQRVIKLVRARAKDGYMERLTAIQMVQLDNHLQNLAKEISLKLEISPTTSAVLSSCVHSYANRLATRFHNEHREKLILLLDSDLWKAAEVPSQIQELAKHINNHSGISLLYKNGMEIKSEYKKNSQSLQLEHNQFTVVAAALMLFQMIVEYCQCASDLRNMSAIPELIFCHLTSLLETFNSRTCQLVLGAKARKLNDLETISARNLALAARSLQMVLAFTPRISVHFSNIALIKSSLYSQLHDIEQKYQSHIDQINSKLISLMDERINSRMLSWTGKPPSPSSETRAICQHLTKLHDAISDIYPPASETELFLKIHNVYKTHLRSRMREMNIMMDNGPQHGLVKQEVAYYMSQLNSFGGLQKFTDNFSDIWR